MSTGYIRGNIQERNMDIIPTTATAAEKLKRLAKTRRKATGTSLAAALDTVAKEHGYCHWKHVTVCVEQTAIDPTSKPLPEELKQLLDSAVARDPASTDSQHAFASGFAFAMDVKDAEQISQASDCVECDDAWHIAAREVWRVLVHHRDIETNTTLFETQSTEELKTTVLDDLGNYRLFRYVGNEPPTSLEDAYKWINQQSFFPAAYVWLRGKFIDLSEMPEIRVDGKVVFSTTSGSTKTPPPGARPRLDKFGHLLTAEERTLFDKMAPKEQEFWLFQLEKETPVGKARYKSVQNSTTVSWRDAKKL